MPIEYVDLPDDVPTPFDRPGSTSWVLAASLRGPCAPENSPLGSTSPPLGAPEAVNPFRPFPELETERFRLRALRAVDAAVIFGYFADPEVTRYFGMEPFAALDQAEQFIARYEAASEAGKALRWGVALKETNALIGTCGFHGWSREHRRAEIGFEVMPARQRTGTMSEVLPVILSFGFEHMDLNRVTALISLENAASIRLIENLGFQREGVLRQYSVTAGIPEDLLSYSLLRHERAGFSVA